MEEPEDMGRVSQDGRLLRDHVTGLETRTGPREGEVSTPPTVRPRCRCLYFQILILRDHSRMGWTICEEGVEFVMKVNDNLDAHREIEYIPRTQLLL